jgi:hypothetical protein
MVRTLSAFPRVQTEAQQDDSLEEVFARESYRVNGIASFADYLSGHAFPSVEIYTHLFVRRGVSAII